MDFTISKFLIKLMLIGKFLKNVDIFGASVGLHFGRWITKEKGHKVNYKTEVGGIITCLCLMASIVAFTN